MVNPHNSLLLGVSDIETPAEIDGLLDNYFDSDNIDAMAYNDASREMSSSEVSLQTAVSNVLALHVYGALPVPRPHRV